MKFELENSVRNRRVLACAVLGMSAVAASSAFGQSTSTWIPTQNGGNGGSLTQANLGGNWATPARWTTGVPADGGGIAVFPEATGLHADVLNNYAADIAFVNGNFTLSEIDINSAEAYRIGESSGTITLTGAGILNVSASPNAGLRAQFTGHYLDVTLAGGPLVKTGAGTVYLGYANTFVGGTTLSGGVLRIASDASLGAAGNTLTFDGGALSGSPSSRAIQVNAAGGTFLGGSPTLNGSISGSGPLTFSGANPTLTANSSYSGAMSISGSLASTPYPQTTISGNGALTALTTLDLTGKLTLDNTATAISNRIGNNATVTSRGATLAIHNVTAATGASAEVFNALNITGGMTTINLQDDNAAAAAFAIGSITRDSTATLFTRGVGSGAASANLGTIALTGTPAGLTNGLNNAGTGAKILPWAIGINDATSIASFLTYSNGVLRPLIPNTGATGEATNVSTANISAAVAATISANTNLIMSGSSQKYNNATNVMTANSLVVRGTLGVPTNPNFTATISSGATLFTQQDNVSFPIIFPNGVKGYLFTTGSSSVASNLTTSNTLTGTGGILKAGNGSWTVAYGTAGTNSAYTGGTTFTGGSAYIPGNIPSDLSTPSALGIGDASSPIQIVGSVVDGGGGTAVYFGYDAAAANVTVARPIAVTGDSYAHLAGLVAYDPTGTITYTGGVNLGTSTTMLSIAQGTHIFNAPITGPGAITDSDIVYNTFGTVVFNAANTFSGGVHMFKSTYVLGNDAAVGTGPLEIGGQGSAATKVDAVAGPGGDSVRTIANNVLYDGSVYFGTYNGASVPLVFTGTIDLDGGGGGDVFEQRVLPGVSVTFAGPVTRGAIFKNGAGTLTLSNPSNSYTGDTFVNAGTLNLLTAIRNHASLIARPNSSFYGNVAPVVIQLGAAASPTANTVVGEFSAIKAYSDAAFTSNIYLATTDRSVNRQTVLISDTVDMTAYNSNAFVGGTLNLANNDMLVHSTSAAQLGTYVATGHLVASTSNPLAGLAVITNSDGRGGTLYPTFDGIAAVSTDTLVKYTYIGDTDLNGYVDGVDLANLLAGEAGGLKGWINGDINYDGVVNDVDLALLKLSLEGQTGSFGNPDGGPSGAVPEPGVATIFLPAVASLGRRRRR